MDKIIILGHENPDVDSIVSGYLLEKILIKKGDDVKFIIPDKVIGRDTLDICMRNGLEPSNFMVDFDLNDNSYKYILVDHHEREVGGEIVCIIDHHPTNKSFDIEHYYNKMISSTACFIAYENEDLLDKFDIKLACLATLVDTVSFHSTKGRDIDKEWVISMCNKYDFDYNELYKEGIYLTNLDNIDKASLNGLKKYCYNGNIVESSFIQIDNPNYYGNQINKMINILKNRVNDIKLDVFVFIVYDMTNFKTTYYLITKEDVKERVYDIYASRGNTIMPEIEKYFSEK